MYHTMKYCVQKKKFQVHKLKSQWASLIGKGTQDSGPDR